MRITVDAVRQLTFADGTPVTAASAVAPLGGGWLVVPDDATIAAWVRPDGVVPVRLLPPVESLDAEGLDAEGLDHFSEAAGTKHLKPDLEVACPAEVDGEPAVLLLGSGSTSRRMRGVLVRLAEGEPVVVAGELGALYARVGAGLGVAADQLNLEGASRHGDTVRWFNRGNPVAGVLPGSVDLPLAGLVDAVLGRAGADAVPVDRPRTYDLGRVAGVGLAVTDAVSLPDGRQLLSAAAEDTPNTVDDGPVVAAALALVDGDSVQDVTVFPEVGGRVHKVEGLALRAVHEDGVQLVAVVDDDDPGVPSTWLELRVALG